MSDSSSLLGRPRRIAVVRALQLGDLLCAVPALRSLRAGCPDAHITLIGLSWARDFAARFSHLVDDFMEFPGVPGLPESPARVEQWPAFLREAQERRFDAAIQLHGSGRLMNPFTRLLGAPVNAGYFEPGNHCPDPARFFPWQDREHEVVRFVRLMRELGMPDRGTELEFPIDPAERAAVKRFGLPPHGYACVHPGSQLASRRWPPERFAAVADALADDGYRIVLTGTAGEARLTQAVKGAMTSMATDLTGRTSLGELAALVKQAALVVCNDTGISHIAAAVQTRSVVVACGSDIERWHPLDRERHHVLHQPMPCRPCAHETCPLEGHPCAAGLEVPAVIDSARHAFQAREMAT